VRTLYFVVLEAFKSCSDTLKIRLVALVIDFMLRRVRNCQRYYYYWL